ncbi:MAG: hypothetical protein ACRDOK_00405 [Streptosporangiaceae bacterium]
MAGRIQAEQTALDWVTAPQRVVVLQAADAQTVACGWEDGVLVRFTVRAGRIRGWCSESRSATEAAPLVAQKPPCLRDLAAQNASLAAKLTGGTSG